MKQLRAYLIGGAIGALALAMLPLSGALDHRATSASPLSGWYHWLANRQSVTLRSLTLVPPDLTDPRRAARAAGHYELVCAACHGSPAAPPKLMAEALSPPPPILALADRWRPAARVFQTVKYGIHQSAMPGWPVQNRDDEVWDMVAFLERLPKLDAASYRAMAGQGGCRDCHGESGQGKSGVPRLDLQTPEYIAQALRDYRAGVRASGTMMSVARGLSDAQIAEHAAEFGLARQYRPQSVAAEADTLLRHGLPARDIPACLSCHGAAAQSFYPRLEGQDADYLRRQLSLFSELGQERGGSRAHIMAPIAQALTPQMIDALAEYLGR